ncbi:MAG: hypothetical protein ACKPFA_22135, partial [Dolichospermum sp.]
IKSRIQTAIPAERFAIASPQLPKHSFFNEPQRHRERAIAPPPTSQTSFFNEPQRHRGHREREIALPSKSQKRSHPLNSPTPKQ